VGVPNRDDVHKEAGGISGAPLRDRSTEVIRLETNSGSVAHYWRGRHTAEDAWEKITAGASLAQVYTGWTRTLDGASHFRGFAAKLEERGLASISEAVGREAIVPSPFILAAAKLLSVR